MIITKKTCAAILIAALPVVNSYAEEPPAKNSSWWQSWLSWLGIGQEEVQKTDPAKHQKVDRPESTSGSQEEVQKTEQIKPVFFDQPVFFDFGTKTSQLAEGFIAVTPASAWSPETGFG